MQTSGRVVEQPMAQAAQHHFQEHDIDGGLRKDTLDCFENLQTLGLLENVAELDIKGLTVIPPEKVTSKALIERLRLAILAVLERRTGMRIDPSKSFAEEQFRATPFGRLMSYLLLEDPAFQEMLMNPALLALASYKLGKNCCLSSVQSIVKSRGGPHLDLHTDELYVSEPYAQNTGGVNLTVAITDYFQADGPTRYVPGSHKMRRKPIGAEGRDQMVTVEAPAGSLIVWDGALWHGSVARKSPGLRLSVIYYLMRPHMRVQEDYKREVTEEILAKQPPRFRALLGKNLNLDWKQDGPRLDGADTLVGANPYC